MEDYKNLLCLNLEELYLLYTTQKDVLIIKIIK